MLPRLKVSDNGRFLVTEKGKPFFWMGDTAWELFHRLDRKEARKYLDNRRRNRFNLIQAVALAELDGLHTPNRYGEKPLIGDDPARPNERYFKYIDEVIRMAGQRGLYVGFLPTWADKVNEGQWGVGPVVLNEGNAHAYGRFLGARYRDDTNIVWILGGDRPAVHEGKDYRPVWRAMAAGIDEGAGFRTLKTYHPMGGHSTSEWLHGEGWLDFNMMQSGHGGGRDNPAWEMIERDYALAPAKPTLDGEPNYEDHPVNPWPKWDPRNGYYRDHDVRKQLYRSVFAGGCGVTYGHHFIWQMWDKGRGVNNNGEEHIPWHEAIDRPGAAQVRHLRTLMEEGPFLTRIPDQGMIVSDPGKGATHVRATRDAQGARALVYLPQPKPVTVETKVISGGKLFARWFSPVDGEYVDIGRYPADGPRTFTPPGHRPDWVLVLDRD